MLDVGQVLSRQDESSATVERFVGLAVRGLVPMFNRQQQLFCYKLRKSDSGLVQEGISHRYTMMTLLGLHRLQQAGKPSPLAMEPILDHLMDDLSWVDNCGDLGVLLWLYAVVSPERLAEVERRIDIRTALDRYPDANRGMTMELSWFLTGLAYWALAFPEKQAELKELTYRTYALVKKNQGEGSFFGHLAISGSVAGWLRGRTGSFADQVYPIYGMTQFFRAYGDQEARDRAFKCALGICHAQGPKGQWWWHYDSVRGRVLEGYPVFSVHQHAMAPMTLFALGETIGNDFNPWIYKGLKWINSDNELEYDMEEPSSDLVWRCIFRAGSSVKTYLKAGFSRRSNYSQEEIPGALQVLFECRPYELGWLLYAFANRTGNSFGRGALAQSASRLGDQ